MRSKIVPCVDCGREFPRKVLNHKFRCKDCGYKKVGEVVYQLHTKSGPEYEKWKEAVKYAADGL